MKTLASARKRRSLSIGGKIAGKHQWSDSGGAQMTKEDYHISIGHLRQHSAENTAAGLGTMPGAPGGTRTPDLLLRRQLLYPVELRARGLPPEEDGRGGGIRTHDPLLPKQMRYQTALRPDKAADCISEIAATPAMQRKSAIHDSDTLRRSKTSPCFTPAFLIFNRFFRHWKRSQNGRRPASQTFHSLRAEGW